MQCRRKYNRKVMCGYVGPHRADRTALGVERLIFDHLLQVRP